MRRSLPPVRRSRGLRSVNRRRRVEPLEARDLLAGIQLSVLSTNSVTGSPTAGAAEIGAYDSVSKKVFSTNAAQNSLNVLDVSNPGSPTNLPAISLAAYGAGPNSVAVKNGIVAVAVEASPKTDPGQVVFFDTSGSFLGQVTVGALPDMLAFSPDGSRVLVANEGEPNSYNQVDSVDPEGSVSIINLSGGVAAATVQTADFTAFNGQEAALRAQGIRIYGPNATAAQDFEPEYITLSADGLTAYVALQENNALAVIDVASATVTSLLPLGFKDHNLAGNGLDASDRDTPGASNAGLVNIRNWPVFGIYSPDAIASFVTGGETYLVLANEGDTRDYTGFNEESRAGALTLDAATFAAAGYPDVSTGAAGLRNNDNLGRLTVTTTLGNTDADAEFEALYAPGGRSFSIRRVDGSLVYDSGDDFEQITAAAYPTFFNASNDSNTGTFDTRSDNKGPEPEGVAVGELGGRTYAFIGLERIGGVMVYDVTDPLAPTFVQYLNNRNFAAAATNVAVGDLGLEGLAFVSAADSPTGTPLLIATNELSGTVSLYAINLTPEITALSLPDAGAVAAGETVTLNGTYADDTLGPTHVVTVDWGDGSVSPATVDENARTFTAQHVYAAGGRYSVQATLSDGVFTDDATAVAQVSGWRVAAGELQLVGTDGADVLNLRQLPNGRLLIVSDFLAPRVQSVSLADVTSLWISTAAGNDVVLVDRALQLPGTLDGGAGHDLLVAGVGPSTLLGGGGNDRLFALWGSAVLSGGEGNDLLHAGRGRNVLIGGGGSDLLLAGSGEDIAIGGSTAYDEDSAALAALRALWDSSAPVADRQAAIQASALHLTVGETVFDDDAVDLLVGFRSNDWLFTESEDWLLG